jgi:hypothetical protein
VNPSPARALLDGWQFAGAGLVTLMVVWMVARTAGVIAYIQRSANVADSALAAALADEQAFRAMSASSGRASEARNEAGFVREWRGRTRGGRQMLEIEIATPRNARHAFTCEIMPGSLPRSLRTPLAVVGGRAALGPHLRSAPGVGVLELDEVDFPVVEPAAWRSPDAASCGGFVRDDAIALLRLPGGTDRLDYRVVAGDDGTVRPRFGDGGVLRIEGNLWIEPGPSAVVLEVHGPATLLIDGNLYLERSVRVRGDGSLTLVVHGRDGDWAEGGGRVYLGTAATRRPGPARLVIEATVVARSGGTQFARECEFHGGLVLGGGLAAGHPGVVMHAAADKLPDPRRRVPGIECTGAPRPGRLEEQAESTARR